MCVILWCFFCVEVTTIYVFTAVETSHSKHWTITIMQKPAKVRIIYVHTHDACITIRTHDYLPAWIVLSVSMRGCAISAASMECA